jgi:hypothetical protein
MDPLLTFAQKLLLILASLPGAYRPEADGKAAASDKSLRELLTFERAWPLSLLVAGWYFKKHRPLASQALVTLRATAGVQTTWARFDNPKISLSLEDACTEAYNAETSWELAGASASFDFALKDFHKLGAAEAFGGMFFQVLATALREALPPPPDLPARFKAALGGQAPEPEAPAKSASPARPTAPRPPAAATPVAATAPSISTPQLSEYDQCVTYLASRGYSQAQITALCGGPKGGRSEGEA